MKKRERERGGEIVAMEMKKLWISILLMILFLLQFSMSSPDSVALMAFKSSLEDPLPDSLSSWSTNNGSSGHCNWFGVTCNSSTHRVIKLVLNNLNLTASIQPLIQLVHLRHLSLHHNRLYSSDDVTLDLSHWRNLQHLYLSHNRLQGKFPVGISKLRRLYRFDISYNRFSGDIPFDELARIPSLLTLRLEFNSFTGGQFSVNISAYSFDSVTDFNVSCNDLAGRIPGWLSMFPISSFSGNRRLCGDPLPETCSIPTPIPTSPKKKPRRLSVGAVLAIIAVDVIALILVAVTIAYCCYLKARKTEGKERKHRRVSESGGGGGNGGGKMACFEGCKGFSKVDDLLKSSAEMLGKGVLGTTYKVTMDGGDVIVVKRIRERKLRKEFDADLTAMGGVRHHNIVSLRAYYHSKDELLLVYDYLPNGSLHSLLHGNRGPGRNPLDWTTRLKLAFGSANGLCFLHSQNNSKLFHGDLTSSNIIVDQKGSPSLSDGGLFQIFNAFPGLSPTNGHYAPELANSDAKLHSHRFMQRCDVYSFGVVLLEILTGKTATGEGETALVKWVKHAVGIGDGKWKRWDVFDFELVRFREMEEEMMALLGVAMLCFADVPKTRPKMEVVCRKIQDIIRFGGGSCGGGGASSLDDHRSDSSPASSETTHNFTSN